MESIERWALDEVPLSYSRPRQGIGDTRFPLNRGAALTAVDSQKWVSTVDYLTEEIVQVPYYVVKMYTGTEKLVEKPWYVTTNGMSAGNTRDEAILSGLYEAIERDGVHLDICRSFNGMPIRKLDLSTIDFPMCKDLIEKIKHAGCHLFVYDARNEISAPTFVCLIADREKSLGLWRGYGTES